MPLVTRTRLNTSIRNDLYPAFEEIHKELKIDKTKLIDIAIELLIEEYKTKKNIGLK